MKKLGTAFALSVSLSLLAIGVVGCEQAKVTKRLKAANHYAATLCECTDDACRADATAKFESVMNNMKTVELDEDETAELEATQSRIASCAGAATGKATTEKAN
jgi:hypothetical protein